MCNVQLIILLLLLDLSAACARRSNNLTIVQLKKAFHDTNALHTSREPSLLRMGTTLPEMVISPCHLFQISVGELLDSVLLHFDPFR